MIGLGAGWVRGSTVCLRVVALLALSTGALTLGACGDDGAVGPVDGGVADGSTMPGDAGREGDAGAPDATVGNDAGEDADAGLACSAGECPPAEDLSRDVISTALELDLATSVGTATIALGPSERAAASFETGDLVIGAVRLGDVPLRFEMVGRRLDVGVPASAETVTIEVEYTFTEHDEFDGWMPASGVSFLWPTFCGNLFPCHSDPSDGSTFEMVVTGAPADVVVIHPAAIEVDAPTYMPAIAMGDYRYQALGTTSAGTEVGVHYLPANEAAALVGTENLRDYFQFLETTYGDYAYGSRVASVEAAWGPGAYGGMEHHPYWHVASDAMEDPVVHAHEAAHGWFGNGVRIACWEDFVLSEGLASYLALRAIEAAEGTLAGDEVRAEYVDDLAAAVASGDTIALPDTTCNEIDLLTHPLWSGIPYMKGAFFMIDVEALVGRAPLDAAIASFYAARVGTAARMMELVVHIETETGANLDALVDTWLRSLS